MAKVLEIKRQERERKEKYSAQLKDRTPSSRFRFCKHFAILIDETSRTITCKYCGEFIDPFYWITLLANEEHHRNIQYWDMLERIKELEQIYERRKEQRRKRLPLENLPESILEKDPRESD